MKILFITRFDFTSDRNDGGKEISYRNYSFIKEIVGEENIFLAIITSQQKKNSDHICYFYTQDNIVSNYISYLMLKDRIFKKTEKEIIRYIKSVDVNIIFFDGSTFGQLIGSLPSYKSIVYFHNIERQYTWEQVKYHNFMCLFRYIATRYNEKKMVSYTSHYICINQRDANLLKKYYRANAELLLPATFEDTYECVEEEKCTLPLKLLFIGSYFAHNYKGLLWFIDNVMPSVNAELVVIGKNMECLQKDVRVPNVTVIGTVDQLKPFYDKADAVVMPIFMGGGMKVKTAESMMYGKTIFASREALEGYETDGVDGIYECNSKEEFISAINAFSRKSNFPKCNENIRKLFLDKYCSAKYKDSLRDYLQVVMESEPCSH